VKPGDVVCVKRLNSEGFNYQISIVEQRPLTATERSSSSEDPLPEACDNPEPARRIHSAVSRIVRDTSAAKRLKRKYDWQCQVCAQRLLCWPGRFYIEVHHLRPLGTPHNGLDKFNNMLVLCPNHHALFDFGVPRFLSSAHVEISGHGYELIHRHAIGPQNINYYMESVYRSVL
jgi:predicted restriction endonuclease